jgi:hypothetical protein
MLKYSMSLQERVITYLSSYSEYPIILNGQSHQLMIDFMFHLFNLSHVWFHSIRD